jgi:hypothetical protein
MIDLRGATHPGLRRLVEERCWWLQALTLLFFFLSQVLCLVLTAGSAVAQRRILLAFLLLPPVDRNETRDVARDTARATAGVDTESRYQRRRRLLNNARVKMGSGPRWRTRWKVCPCSEKRFPTLAPMTGFLRGAVDLYTTFRPDA